MGRCRGMCGWSRPCGRCGLGTLLGVLLVLLGLFLIFLCIPFRLWVVLFGAALIVLGYFLIRTP